MNKFSFTRRSSTYQPLCKRRFPLGPLVGFDGRAQPSLWSLVYNRELAGELFFKCRIRLSFSHFSVKSCIKKNSQPDKPYLRFDSWAGVLWNRRVCLELTLELLLRPGWWSLSIPSPASALSQKISLMLRKRKLKEKITAVPSIGCFLSNRTAVLLFFSFPLFLSSIGHFLFLFYWWPIVKGKGINCQARLMDPQMNLFQAAPKKEQFGGRKKRD